MIYLDGEELGGGALLGHAEAEAVDAVVGRPRVGVESAGGADAVLFPIAEHTIKYSQRLIEVEFFTSG